MIVFSSRFVFLYYQLCFRHIFSALIVFFRYVLFTELEYFIIRHVSHKINKIYLSSIKN